MIQTKVRNLFMKRGALFMYVEFSNASGECLGSANIPIEDNEGTRAYIASEIGCAIPLMIVSDSIVLSLPLSGEDPEA